MVYDSARGAAPGRTKGALGGARENQGCNGRRPSEKTQVPQGDAQEEQGRVGWHPEEPRARWLAPGRMIKVVIVTVVIVVAIV